MGEMLAGLSVVDNQCGYGFRLERRWMTLLYYDIAYIIISHFIRPHTLAHHGGGGGPTISYHLIFYRKTILAQVAGIERMFDIQIWCDDGNGGLPEHIDPCLVAGLPLKNVTLTQMRFKKGFSVFGSIRIGFRVLLANTNERVTFWSFNVYLIWMECDWAGRKGRCGPHRCQPIKSYAAVIHSISYPYNIHTHVARGGPASVTIL